MIYLLIKESILNLAFYVWDSPDECFERMD